MTCRACGEPCVYFEIPEPYLEYTERLQTGETVQSVGAICTRCLSVRVESGREPPQQPDFARISAAFPTDPAQAVPFALAVGLCSSLAMNREEIVALCSAVERAGGDPLLVLERLASDETLEPAVSIARRRHQLEQLL